MIENSRLGLERTWLQSRLNHLYSFVPLSKSVNLFKTHFFSICKVCVSMWEVGGACDSICLPIVHISMKIIDVKAFWKMCKTNIKI